MVGSCTSRRRKWASHYASPVHRSSSIMICRGEWYRCASLIRLIRCCLQYREGALVQGGGTAASVRQLSARLQYHQGSFRICHARTHARTRVHGAPCMEHVHRMALCFDLCSLLIAFIRRANLHSKLLLLLNLLNPCGQAQIGAYGELLSKPENLALFRAVSPHESRLSTAGNRLSTASNRLSTAGMQRCVCVCVWREKREGCVCVCVWREKREGRGRREKGRRNRPVS